MALLAAFVLVTTLCLPAAALALTEGEAAAAGAETHGGLGATLPVLAVAPFCLLLLLIAVLPLTLGHWWEHNRNKAILSLALGIPVGIWLWTQGHDGQHSVVHSLREYLAFIALLGALFVIAGGIYLRGTPRGGPGVNTAFLLVGGVLASFIGTTGAAMVLIRPVIRANAWRRSMAHVIVFFIFIVANIGGCLTPLGDPPLFLGFLRGVPFTWTFQLVPEWVAMLAIVLAIFYAWDAFLLRREGAAGASPAPAAAGAAGPERMGLEGAVNGLFLAGVLGANLAIGILSSQLGADGQPVYPFLFHYQTECIAAAMVALAAVSLACTPAGVREKNKFTYAPIIEVAVLFIGIFLTMIPALLILNAGRTPVPITEPWHYFWATGILSSFLDNAPTYLTYASTACGFVGADANNLRTLLEVPATEARASGAALLAAISCGAVFMGANTYIGNGPNFMVKAIAEESGIRMPSFFGYMVYSGLILLPSFALVTVIFFRGGH
ncbi:MAG: sodium:proton antiporter [Planctomycetes bacterium]|nr:sodium:proton antiporter [Planctomycetota bacterium]